ncbi:Retrovirus-related Pol polyprotein from transposon RE1 [Linum perenne]
MTEKQVDGGGDYPLSDPYYLHGSEQPGQPLVAEKLTISNYTDWSRSMNNALGAKNKLGFINGTIKEPEAADSRFWPWTRCNIMVLSWIQQSVESEIRKTIMSFKKAADAWNSLKGRYGQGDVVRIAELQEELSNLKQGNQSITKYHGNIITLRDELRNYQPFVECDCTATSHLDCNAMKVVHKYEETNDVIHFLRGLNENFAGPRSQVLFGDELPDLEKVVQRMVQHERQLYGTQGKQPMGETMAMAVQQPVDTQDAHMVSYAGGFNRPFRPNMNNKPRQYCTFCKMTNHTVETCYFKNGWPPNMEPRNPNSTAGTFRPRAPTMNNRFRPQANAAQAAEGQGVHMTQAQFNQLMMQLKKPDETNSHTGAHSAAAFTHEPGQTFEDDYWFC